jgi:methyl-accepting chemotaxis protein
MKQYTSLPITPLIDRDTMDDKIMYSTDKVEVQIESASVCSKISKDSRESNVSEPKEMEDRSTKHTSKLCEMMLERIESIDIIQKLVEKEIEQDSALIAEFTEKVLELEIADMKKYEEIECLRHMKNDMQLEIQQLMTKNDHYVEELSACVAQVDSLTHQNDQLETQNKNLTAIAESIQSIKARNQQMEEIISSITASLKDAKHCLE